MPLVPFLGIRGVVELEYQLKGLKSSIQFKNRNRLGGQNLYEGKVRLPFHVEGIGGYKESKNKVS